MYYKLIRYKYMSFILPQRKFRYLKSKRVNKFASKNLHLAGSIFICSPFMGFHNFIEKGFRIKKNV